MIRVALYARNRANKRAAWPSRGAVDWGGDLEADGNNFGERVRG